MRILFMFVALLILSGCHFPKALSSYYAKEVCSCLFVVKQSEQYCHDFGSELLPNWSTNIDRANKTVKASALFQSTEARFLSERKGCQIVH